MVLLLPVGLHVYTCIIYPQYFAVRAIYSLGKIPKFQQSVLGGIVWLRYASQPSDFTSHACVLYGTKQQRTNDLPMRFALFSLPPSRFLFAGDATRSTVGWTNCGRRPNVRRERQERLGDPRRYYYHLYQCRCRPKVEDCWRVSTQRSLVAGERRRWRRLVQLTFGNRLKKC